MNIFSKIVDSIRSYISSNWITLLVYGVIIVVIFAMVQISVSHRNEVRAKLLNTDPQVRSNEVLALAMSQTLADSLNSTQDLNSPATDPVNVESVKLREDAAVTLNNLIDKGKVPTDIALTNLFTLRKDSDAGVKATATAGLASIGSKSEDNLKQVAQRLSDGDPDIRSAAADALAKIGGANSAALVAGLVNDPSAGSSVFPTLTSIGKASIPYLTPMVSGSDFNLKTQAITALAQISDPSAVPSLKAQLDQPNQSPTIRRMCVISLAEIVLNIIPSLNTAGSVPSSADTANLALCRSLIPIFAQTLDAVDEDSFARARSAIALGRLGGDVAAKSLLGALGDFDTRVEQAAMTGIQELGPSVVPGLTAATHSSNLATRIAAATTLGGIADSSALESIKVSLADPNANVREAAVTALGISAKPDAVPLLIPELSDQSGIVADAASKSLHFIGTPAIPQLVATLGSSNTVAALNANQALQQIGSDAVPLLISAASNSSASEDKKVWAAVTLGQIRDIRAKETLVRLAETGSKRQQWAASQALQQLS